MPSENLKGIPLQCATHFERYQVKDEELAVMINAIEFCPLDPIA
jgi:ferredoxin